MAFTVNNLRDSVAIYGSTSLMFSEVSRKKYYGLIC